MIDMVFSCKSFGLFGLESFMVSAEAYVSCGKEQFDIVGLPDTAVKESRERVRSALINCGFTFPEERITVNLAPADRKKEGPLYDLPILVAILLSTGQLKVNVDDSAFLGELSLGGELRRVNGVLPMVLCARESGIKKLFVPYENACEGALVREAEVYPVRNITDLVLHLTGKKTIQPAEFSEDSFSKDNYPDFSGVYGQIFAKRALEVAASGGHNVLLIGPPGSGKSMLAKRIPGILPDMTFEERLETTKVLSVSGELPQGVSLVKERPFRSPHHTVSYAAMTGGGSIPRPGEISLANNGVLFLDELPEFSRKTLEALRQPLEDGTVTISRINGTVTYPSNIMLVAAMNPCPCGYYTHPAKKCKCSKNSILRYLNRVSGPLLDRIDIHLDICPVDINSISAQQKGEDSKTIRERVNRAREIQNERFKGTQITCNANITPELMPKYCVRDEKANKKLEDAFEKLGLSVRAYDKLLKVARTVADLDQSEIITSKHISEAIRYRSLDRKYWGE